MSAAASGLYILGLWPQSVRIFHPVLFDQVCLRTARCFLFSWLASPQKKTKKTKTQICSTSLSDFSFYSFSWRRNGDEKCESCKSVTEMDHFKVAGVTFIPHICRINTFWNDWWVFCFCCFVSPSVRSPPLSWLMQIYIYSAGPCRGKLTGRLH